MSEKLPVPDPSSPFLNISFSIFICLESFRSSRRRCFDGLSFVTVLISFDYQVCLFWRGGPLRATRLFGGTSRTMNESEHINKRRRNCTDIKAHVCNITLSADEPQQRPRSSSNRTGENLLTRQKVAASESTGTRLRRRRLT